MEDQTEAALKGLRRLLACPECKLQYDVSKLEIGSRFRCSCGQLMAVPRFQSHDARVVRCSSCGGPRLEQSSNCRFCGAKFTLHERDLHTICPGCLTRIADRARFCHSCGMAIVPQAAAGELTDYPCPACEEGHKLRSRQLGEVEIAVLECGCCGGIWLGHELFGHLQETALEREISCHRSADDGPLSSQASASKGGQAYRRCPLCKGHMSRRNFEKRSGVILDMCPKDGVWLDMGELDSILRWIRAGGLSRARAAEARRQREAVKPFRRPGDPLEQAGSILDDSGERGVDPGADFVRGLIQFFS